MKLKIILLVALAVNSLWGEARVYTLDLAVKTALENNNQYLASKEAVKSAEGKADEASSGFLPKLNLFGSYNYISTIPAMTISLPVGASTITKTVQTGANDNWAFKAQLSQTIFDWGRMFESSAAAGLGKDAAEEDRRAASNNTVFAVNQAFYGLVFAKQALKVSEEAMKTAEEHLKDAESKYKEGVSSSFEVLRSKVQVSALKPSLSKAANVVENAKYVLKNLLGLRLSSDIDVDGTFVERPIKDMDYESVAILAGQFRPEFVSLKKKRDALEKSRSVASTLDKPVLTGTVSYNYQNPYFSQLSWADSWNAGLNLNIPLFDGNIAGAKVKQADADLKSIEYALKSMENAIELELKQIQLSLKEIKARTEAQKDAISQAEEYHKIAGIGFKSGSMTNLEVVDAEMALLNAKTAYLQALYDREVAEAALVKCIGAREN